MKSKTKWLTAITTLAVVFVLVLSLGLSSIFASADDEATADKTRYYSDYDTVEEADDAVKEMNLSLAEEGIVLLKNDGSLPLATSSRVSVFGVAQDCLNETEGTITESVKNAGFAVNERLESYYATDSATNYNAYGSEPALGSMLWSSVSSYNDVGIVVIARGSSGEDAISAGGTGEKENETYLGEDQKWKHENSPEYITYKVDEETGKETETVDLQYSSKHELELTDSEEDLIAQVEQTCKKVVILYSGAQVLEMANLENDDKIDGILWIGRPGDGGIDAVGEVLSGAINPSGKTVDEWTRDLTNDPTYANAASTDYTDEKGAALVDESASVAGTAYNGIDYEEDIYLGYKFYETYWAEASSTAKTTGATAPSPKIYDGNTATDSNGYKTATADEWYEYNVLYPFGYGLSYTSFSYNLEDVTVSGGSDSSLAGKSISCTDVMTSTNLSSSMSGTTASPAKISELTATVKVTNEGTKSGKETVQIYVQAPYDGTVEKPYYTLVGFGKTGELNPGQSETLEISFNVQDFASYDYSNANSSSDSGHTGYELASGSYTIHVMESSAHTNIVDETTENKTNAYEAAKFTLDSQANLDLDDYSGNEITNLFSNDDEYNSLALAAEAGSMVSPLDANEGTSATILSRANFDGTMPKAPTSSETKLSGTALAKITRYDNVDADEVDSQGNAVWTDSNSDPWYHGVADLAGWTQGAGVDEDGDGLYDDLILDDMVGVPLSDSSWVTFMNQLTWDEICALLNSGYHMTAEISTIGKVETDDENGPNMISNGPRFTGTPTRSATWNQDLMYQSGIVAGSCSLMHNQTGYYGPGANTHRSPFEGRTAEYFSQDGIQGGAMSAAFCRGMTERGIIVYVKHFALNDYGTPSNCASTCVNVSEQAMREIYLKPFQMSMQEGEAKAAMTSLNRVGAIYAGQDYALQQLLAKDEWGWDGFFITDTIAMVTHMSVDGLIRFGGNLPDGDFVDGSHDYGVASGEWVEDYDWSNDTTFGSTWKSMGESAPKGAVVLKGVVTTTTGEGDEAVTTTETKEIGVSPTQWYCARTAAMQMLYNFANSAVDNNGVTVEQMETYPATADDVVQAAAYGVDTTGNRTSGAKAVVDPELADRVTSSTVVDGTLPEGMYIENGYLYGTARESGTFTVTVESYVDYWIPLTSTVSITVSASIVVDTSAGMTVDERGVVFVTVASDAGDPFEGMTYDIALADGELPDGVEIDNEYSRLIGTPTEAGTYTFTLAVTFFDPNNKYYMDWNDYTIDIMFQLENAAPGFSYWVNDYGVNYFDEEGNFLEGKFCNDVMNGLEWGGVPFDGRLGAYIHEKEGDVYYVDCTITVSYPADYVASDGSGSSSGNALAITGLVLGIVAIVLAAAVLVIVLMKRGGNGGDKKDEESSEGGDGSDAA